MSYFVIFVSGAAYPLSILSISLMLAGMLLMLGKAPKFLWIGGAVLMLGVGVGSAVLVAGI